MFQEILSRGYRVADTKGDPLRGLQHLADIPKDNLGLTSI
ncbi:hypothetical protein CYB_1078 [Synechococcus sp. JA-2-3B'a(2-13)]|nr:hypothetical protein CYB_1078 [Synechococcus sp. JA-2-3B'a(2-13)]